MILVEDYQLNYELFLAEQELFEKTIGFSEQFVNESIGLISLKESMMDTIKNYLGTVIESIQRAWNRFKEILTTKKNEMFIKHAQKVIDSIDPKFIIDNYPTYDVNVVDNLKVVPYNHQEMKPYLESKQSFFKQYYSSVYVDENKSFLENVTSKSIRSVKDTRMTKDLSKEMIDFLTDFPNKMNNVENDLKIINDASTAAQKVAAVEVVSNTESVLILYEAEGDDKKEKVGFTDDPDAKKSNTSYVKEMSIYFKSTTEVLSTKMKIYRDMYALYFKCLKHYIKLPKEDKKEETVKTTQNKATQVEV